MRWGERSPPGDVVPPRRRPKTILVVEDDAATREAVIETLSDQGYRAIGASNGRAALELLGGLSADLILLDLRMPVLDGWQLYLELKRNPELARVPVVIMSGVPIDAAKKARINSPLPGWLEKPFDAEELVGTVEKVLVT